MSSLGIAVAIVTGAARIRHRRISDIQSNEANLGAVPAKERRTTQIVADVCGKVQTKG
jgi:hypothetical protein